MRVLAACVLLFLAACSGKDPAAPFDSVADIEGAWFGSTDDGEASTRLAISQTGVGKLTAIWSLDGQVVSYDVNSASVANYAVSLDVTPIGDAGAIEARATGARDIRWLYLHVERDDETIEVRMEREDKLLARIETLRAQP